MKGKGISHELIIEAATELVIEKGYNHFTMRELAQKLHCKAASLYNHIDGIDDVNREIGSQAVKTLNRILEEAVDDCVRDEAIEAIAYAYRNFVKYNYELYQAIMDLPSFKNDEVLDLGRDSARVIRRSIAQYRISRESAIHYSRSFRASLRGFALNEMAGYYTSSTITSEQSFQFLIDMFVKLANQMECEQNPPVTNDVEQL